MISFYTFVDYNIIITQDGRTPLFFASFNGHLPVVRILLEKGAGVNICDKVHTYIHRAILLLVMDDP